MCSKPCFIECGKCFVVISYFGEKHGCPDDDESFYDVCEGSMLLCQKCEDLKEDDSSSSRSRPRLERNQSTEGTEDKVQSHGNDTF